MVYPRKPKSSYLTGSGSDFSFPATGSGAGSATGSVTGSLATSGVSTAYDLR